MRLLGNFPSQLNGFYYAGLLDLVKAQIAAGEYASGSLFDAAAVAELQAKGQTFTSLAVPGAGNKSLDDDVNTPLNLIDVRYAAIEQEVDYLKKTIDSLVDTLIRETMLLDQLIAYTSGAAVTAALPQLTGANSYTWNFSGGLGAISADFAPQDPTTQLVLPGTPSIGNVFNTVTGTLICGVLPVVKPRTIAPKNLKWIFSTKGESETSAGLDWAELSVLESKPRLVFNTSPTVQPATVTSIFAVTPVTSGGSVPIYVNMTFVPRRSETTTTIPSSDSSKPVKITPYRVEPENTTVRVNGTVYNYGIDFNVTVDGSLTGITLPLDKTLIVDFEEYYPAYQCSVDQVNWSDVIMLDPDRPYPDGTTNFGHLDILNISGYTLFPLTNETGHPTGMYMRMIGIPRDEMVFSVSTPASEIYGMPASLTIDMDRPAYLTGLSLAPYTSYPQVLKTITCQGVTGAPIVLFNGSLLIDRPMVITFPRTSVRSLTLSMVQENYTVKQYSVDPPDKLRRDTLNSLQSVVPFALRTLPPAIPDLLSGYLYSFGLESVEGLDWSVMQLPSVFVTGPYRSAGSPQVIRIDSTVSGSVDLWLCSKTYSGSGQLLNTNLGTRVLPGTAIPVPIGNGIDRSTIGYTDFYLKYVLRSQDAVVSNFNLQVTHV